MCVWFAGFVWDRFEPDSCPFQFGFHHQPRLLQCCLGSRGIHWTVSPLLVSFGYEDCRVLIVGPGVKPNLYREAPWETAAHPHAGHPVSWLSLSPMTALEFSLTHVCSVLGPSQLPKMKLKDVCTWLHRARSCMGSLLSLTLLWFYGLTQFF